MSQTGSASTNKELLSSWVDSYGDEMYSWAVYKTSDSETARDLIQDTFISAFNAIENFRENSNPKTWLYTILNNKIIDHYRSKAKQKHITESELQANSETDSLFTEKGYWSGPSTEWKDEEHLLDNADFLTVLEKCLEALPDKWKAVTKAKYYDDKKGSHISKELGITSSNLWQILHRSKLKLKKCIDIYWSKE